MHAMQKTVGSKARGDGKMVANYRGFCFIIPAVVPTNKTLQHEIDFILTFVISILHQ